MTTTEPARTSHLDRSLDEVDPDLAALIVSEKSRQREGLQLIASENVVSDAVREAVGSCLTNKYAEGRPGRRYYSGCEVVDQVERLAEERARAMFKTDYHVNVQPHSGTQANLEVYLAALKPGEPMLAMELNHGGHLSHGFHINESGKLYAPHFYTVRPQAGDGGEQIDYDQVESKAREVRPKLIVCGASAYPRRIDFERFAAIAKSVDALLLADISHIAGLVAAGEHPSPFGHADFVTTTTHKTLRGPRGGMVFATDELRRKINSAVFPGQQGGPLMHQIAGKAVAFKEALEPSFVVYQKAVRANARALAGRLVERGFRLVSGGTDNHLILVDLGGKLTGAEAEDRLTAERIFVNKNLIPYDTRSAKDTSGIRIGTPAMTARGLDENDFRGVGDLICDVLDGQTAGVAARVAAFTSKG